MKSQVIRVRIKSFVNDSASSCDINNLPHKWFKSNKRGEFLCLVHVDLPIGFGHINQFKKLSAENKKNLRIFVAQSCIAIFKNYNIFLTKKILERNKEIY